ncbi:MAG TPA: hypothetical protein VM370_13425 [Candidatus Thermoplasmatota archaeon]|nr:hypothetical protein [Candidatus Thermoplasmatota archaeon]
MRRRRPARGITDPLPEGHQIVLLILAEAGRLTWEELVSRAADKGIGEAELHLILHGTPLSSREEPSC